MATLKILVIDDDIDITNLMKMRLQSWGHDVTTAHNWLTVLQLIREHEFDLIIVDVETPTANGLTACQDLCGDPQFANATKVIVTGRSDEETIQRCHQLNLKYIYKSGKMFDELKPVVEGLRDSSLRCSATLER